MSEHLSKFLVGVEIFLLAVPTFLAAILVAGTVSPFLSGSFTLHHGSEALIDTLVGLALLAGAVLAIKFLSGGVTAIRQANRLWWYICGVASLVSLASTLAIWLGGESGASLLTALFSFGALYIVPFLHLAMERQFRSVPSDGA